MTLISINTANLLNGVSQQADDLRRPTQATEQINAVSSLVEGLKKRPPTNHLKKITDTTVPSANLSDFYGFTIDRDVDEKHYIRINTNVSVASMKIDHLLSLSASVTVKNASGATASGSDFDYLKTTDAHRDIRHLTVDDYTFIVNKSISPAFTTSKSADLVPEALLFVQEVRENAIYTTKLWNSESGSGSPDYTATYTASASDDQGDVTSHLVTNLTSAGADSVYSYSSSGSILYIKKSDGTDFRVEITTSYAGGFKMYKDSVDDLGSLPAEGYAGFKIEVTGTADLDTSSYWVEYVSQNSQVTSGFTSGYWQETIGPGESYELDADTMPHVLLSNSDGSFTFKPADWNNKTVGSTDATKDPSFIGAYIRGVLFYQDRLGLLTGEGLVLSEVGEYFNFFRTIYSQAIASDPIDITLSSVGIDLLNYAVTSSEKLIVFSNTTQFSVGYTSTEGLSAQTIESNPVTRYSNFENVNPVQIGQSIFFGFAKGQYSGVREYFVGNTDASFVGDPITDHCPQYIAGDITKLLSMDSENILVVQSADYQEGLYLYTFYDSGKDRVQSAWFKFSFGSTAQVCDINRVGTKIYVLLKRGDDYCIESFDLAAGLKDENSDTVIGLDRRITEEDLVSATYDSVSNKTTLVLPYECVDGETMEIVTRSGDATLEALYANPYDDELQKWPNYSTPSVEIEGTRGEWSDIAGVGYDIYACDYDGGIYKQTNGQGDFELIPSASHTWNGITGYGSDVYVCAPHIGIYKQTNGTGPFVDIGAPANYWSGITALGTDIYACTWGGDIYKQTGGTGAFVALGAPSHAWTDVQAVGSDVYACVNSGDIYKQTGGTGSFVALGETNRQWYGLAAHGSDVYACVAHGSVYKQTGGTGAFEVFEATSDYYYVGLGAGRQLVSYTDEGILVNNVERVNGYPARLEVTGDYSNRPLYIGQTYEMRYVMTRPTIRQQQGQGTVPIYTGRSQVRYATLALNDSTQLTAEVTPLYRDTYTYTFQSKILGTGSSTTGGNIVLSDGRFRIPIMSKSTQFNLTLKNDSPFPSNVLGVTWEVNYYNRSR